jgi:dihydrodipicolinate synthase/N-acetylneuraminate lyase
MIDDRARAVLDRLEGHLIPLTTPFTPDLDVDIPGLAHNVEMALALPESCGVYVGSVYQEFWTLSMAERKAVVGAVTGAVAGRAPVVAGISSTGLAYTLELLEHAESAGVDMVMVWPPMFGDRSDEGVYAFYEEVARTSSTPICVYSSTLRELGFYAAPTLLARLARLPNICAVKEASFSLTTHLALVQELGAELAISTPFEEYWLAGRALVGGLEPNFLMGSSRAMYMQTPEKPRVAECFALGRDGQFAQAYARLAELRPLINKVQMHSFADGGHPIALVKTITELLGWSGGPVRPPTRPAAPGDAAFARSLLLDAGLIEPAVAQGAPA